MNALAPTLTAVRASWSRGQEWLLRSRVLWNSLYSPRSYTAAQRNDGLAGSKRRPLQVNGLHSHLEQLVGMGGDVGLYVA
jgi:hypothetical protein